MPLVPTRQVVDEARRRSGGVAAFNVITLEHAEAIVAGAETAARPVILQISENAVRFHRGNVLPISAAAAAVAATAVVPVALHLDHVEDTDLLHAAAAAGFSSVMFDASSCRTTRTSGQPPELRPGHTTRASGWRRSWARWGARTVPMLPACAPTRSRPGRRPDQSTTSLLAVALSGCACNARPALDHEPSPLCATPFRCHWCCTFVRCRRRRAGPPVRQGMLINVGGV